MGRTNIIIDDDLLKEAKLLAGEKTARATVDRAMREFIERRKRTSILDWEGAFEWKGDLDRLRTPR